MMQDSRARGKLNPITLHVAIKSTHLITGFKEVGRSRSMQGLHQAFTYRHERKCRTICQPYLSKNVQGTDSQARPAYGKTSLIMTETE
jgi:hypothetical protein